MNVILPTADEIAAIHKGDRATINRYYMANYRYLQRVAKSYCRRVHYYGWEDLTQEVFLHFGEISFESPEYFGHDLFKIFAKYRYGGQRKRSQLKGSKCGEEIYVFDKPIKGEEKDVGTLGEAIESDFDMMAAIEPRPDISESLYTYLCGFLGNAKERKRVFAQFYWTGKTYNEIARTLGKNPRTVKRTREEIFKKFRSNADALKEWLYDVGYYERAE